MERNSSILGGALLLTAANLLLRLISIAFNVFLADQIGAAGLGLLQLISTIGVFAMLVGTSGVRVAAMYLSAEEFGHRRLSGVREAVSSCLRYGLIISSVAGVLLFLLADFFSVQLLQDIRAASSLRIMGILLPFTCLCGIMTGYFTACGRIKQLVIIEIAERIVSMTITTLLLLTWAYGDLERSCWAITFGSSTGCMFDFLFLYFRYRKDICHVPSSKEPLHMQKRLIRLCVPLALNDYLRAGLNTAEQLLIPFGLSRYAGSSQQAMADYGTIHGMVFPILMFPAVILYSLSDLLVPELSRCRAMRRQRRIVDLTGKCIRMGILFAGGVAGFLFINAHELGLLIYHSKSAGQYLRSFAPMVLVLYTDAIVDGVLKGLAEQISCVRYNTFTSMLDVLFLFLLLPRWGIRGYIFTFTITHAVNLFLSMRRVLLVSEHRARPSDFVRPLCAALLASFLAFLLPIPNNSLFLCVLLRGGYFLILLCATVLLTGAFTGKDYRWLRRVVLRSSQRIDRKQNSS